MGYELNGDGRSCDGKNELCTFVSFNEVNLPDVDECGLDIDGCDQGCNNTVGSFLCTCSEGYVLNEDGYTCDG